MCMLKRLLLLVGVAKFAIAEDVAALTQIRECLRWTDAVLCLKERALNALNATVYSDKPLSLFGIVDIVPDAGYHHLQEHSVVASSDAQARSMQLDHMLYDKLMDLMASRTIKVQLGSLVEGRGRKKNRYGWWLLAGLGMASIMAQALMGKIAFMAGTALMLSKVALLISAIVGLKKLSSGGGGGGGDTAHIVYADGHGQGGWQRSIAGLDADTMPYRAYSHHQAITDNYAY